MLRHLIAHADELDQYFFRFVVRSNSDTALLDSSNLPMEKCVGDLSDEKYVNQLLQNADVLFHIAGIGRSLPLVKMAKQNGRRRIILVHTTGIYSKYKKAGETYRRIEEEIREVLAGTDIVLTILRPTMIYGNLSDGNVATFIRMVDKYTVFPTVKGAKYELQPVWCGDLGKAYFDVLTHEKETMNKDYILSGGAPIKLIDMFHVIEQYLGKSNHYFSVPFWMAYASAVIIYGLSFRKFDYREKVQRLVEPRAFSHESATKDFNYSPVTFDIGVKEEIDRYLESKAGKRA